MSPDIHDELASLRNEVSRLAAQQQHSRRSVRRWAVTIALCLAGAALAQPVIVTFTADTPAIADDINSSRLERRRLRSRAAHHGPTDRWHTRAHVWRPGEWRQ
jgi:hypothetical protein